LDPRNFGVNRDANFIPLVVCRLESQNHVHVVFLILNLKYPSGCHKMQRDYMNRFGAGMKDKAVAATLGFPLKDVGASIQIF